MMLSDEPERTEDAPLPLATAREMLALAARLNGIKYAADLRHEKGAMENRAIHSDFERPQQGQSTACLRAKRRPSPCHN